MYNSFLVENGPPLAVGPLVKDQADPPSRQACVYPVYPQGFTPMVVNVPLPVERPLHCSSQ